MRIKTIFLIFTFLLINMASVFSLERTESGYIRDVEAKVGKPLTPDEHEIAIYVMAGWLVHQGKKTSQGSGDCLSALSEPEYQKLVADGAKYCRRKSVKAMLHAGKFGEKFLKTVIVLTEDGISNAMKLINKKSQEYDQRHHP